MKPKHKITFLLCATICAVLFFITGHAGAGSLIAVAETPAIDDDAIKEIGKSLDEFKKIAEGKASKEDIEKALNELKSIKTENEALKKTINENKTLIARIGQGRNPDYNPLQNGGMISGACARWLGSIVVLTANNRGKSVSENALTFAKTHLETEVTRFANDPNGADLQKCVKLFTNEAPEIQARASLTTSEIPLPVDYEREIFHLVENYGTFRQYARVFPMGAGDVKLPKTNARPAFGFVDMSGTLGEKAPSISYVDLNAKKSGGLIIIPSEIDEDTIFALGQFLAEYISEEIAQWEDTVGWTADGTSTYKTLKGVTDRIKADEANKVIQLSTGNTATDDVTLASLRLLRGKTNAGVYRRGPAYYMHSSMEALLATFNTGGSVHWNPDRQTLDGYPVRWVDTLNAYSSTAAASAVPVVWGSMNYWVLATRGGLRVDASEHYKFNTDEMTLRARNRFTIGEMNDSAMAGLQLAAS